MYLGMQSRPLSACVCTEIRPNDHDDDFNDGYYLKHHTINLSELKAFADDKIYVSQITELINDKAVNIKEK